MAFIVTGRLGRKDNLQGKRLGRPIAWGYTCALFSWAAAGRCGAGREERMRHRMTPAAAPPALCMAATLWITSEALAGGAQPRENAAAASSRPYVAERSRIRPCLPRLQPIHVHAPETLFGRAAQTKNPANDSQGFSFDTQRDYFAAEVMRFSLMRAFLPVSWRR